MNEFVSWCRHLLVSFLFHALTSLHPPSFYRNDFFHLFHSFFCASRTYWATRARARSRAGRACANDQSVMWHGANGVVQPFPSWAPWSTVVMHREPKTIASRPCTPPSTLEMFGEKISASPGSSKEIAGLLRKMMMIMMMMMMMKMTRKSWNRVWADSRVANWRQVGSS